MPTDPHIVISDLTGRTTDHSGRNRRATGPLAGATLAVKDNIEVAGVPTTQGSRLYGGESAIATSPVVAALEAAGAEVVAKVNLHEFAYGLSSANPHFGAVANPTHPGHVPGGSSGGSAAAVAAGVARLALGTDTAGSVRIPAACVGLVGLRPRQGLLDLTGVAPLCASFDTVGPIAATVAEVTAAWDLSLEGAGLRSARGRCARHGTFLHPSDPSPTEQRPALSRPTVGTGPTLAGVRIGVIDSPDVNALERNGARLESFEIDLDGVLDSFWPAFRAEASRTHAGTFPALADSYDPNVAAKLSTARGVTHERYNASMGDLADRRRALLEAMTVNELDAIATPTLGCPVPLVGASELDYRDALGWYAAPFSALNLPAIALGNLQIVGRTEADVLAVAGSCEAVGCSVVPAPLAAT